MDWQGQKLSEKMMEIMLVIFSVVSFIVGYTIGSFQMMLFIYAGGVLLTALITIPNWPFFNRHPLNWLDPSEAERHPKPQVVAPSKKKGSKNHQK
ncbi:probable signal peptidase complex subunit 1 isoform X2 [Asparagus officinalis]|nr:probable signal peptidase complex subunit 1 isoform X2 [Asparagus officinalis]